MTRLRVDWQQCQGRGWCAEAAPEWIQLDPWGYPIINQSITAQDQAAAKAAIHVCPRLALTMIDT